MFKVRDCSICLEALLINHGATNSDDDDDDAAEANDGITATTTSSATTTDHYPTNARTTMSPQHQHQPQLTFTIPCGHVVHTHCYHAWNKAQIVSSLYKKKTMMMNHQQQPQQQRAHQQQAPPSQPNRQGNYSFLHCATCQTAVEKSYYLPLLPGHNDNNNNHHNNGNSSRHHNTTTTTTQCADCGRGLYADEIVFCRTSQTLRHARCGSSSSSSRSSSRAVTTGGGDPAAAQPPLTCYPIYLVSVGAPAVAVDTPVAPYTNATTVDNLEQPSQQNTIECSK
jgi:hypothetical protein